MINIVSDEFKEVLELDIDQFREFTKGLILKINPDMQNIDKIAEELIETHYKPSEILNLQYYQRYIQSNI